MENHGMNEKFVKINNKKYNLAICIGYHCWYVVCVYGVILEK